MDESHEAGDSQGAFFTPQRLLTYALRAGCLTAGLFSFAVAALWAFQEKLLFHPEIPGRGLKRPEENPPPYQRPDQVMMKYQSVFVTTADNVKLQLWWMPQPDPRDAPTLIYFQGNAGNMGLRMLNFRDMAALLRVNLLAVSYRGYGNSEGTPSELGLMRDAEAALRWVATQSGCDNKRIFLFGRSLGGAVALHTAWRFPDLVRGVVVENTFTSIKDVAVVVFPLLAYIVPLLTYLQRLHFDTLSIVGHVRQPQLYLSGDADTLVPPRQVKALYEKSAAQHKVLHIVKGGTHNDTAIVGGEKYYRVFLEFLQAAEQLPPHKSAGSKAPTLEPETEQCIAKDGASL